MIVTRPLFPATATPREGPSQWALPAAASPAWSVARASNHPRRQDIQSSGQEAEKRLHQNLACFIVTFP
jgi:hypothetical protein